MGEPPAPMAPGALARGPVGVHHERVERWPAGGRRDGGLQMRRRATVGAAVGLAVVMTVGGGAAAAAGGPPTGTPAGTGGGCRENGQAIATVARLVGPFGQIVRTSAPIADDNATFFATICGTR